MSRRRPHPGPVYALADVDALAPVPVDEAVEAMADAGVRWIQLRAKRLSDLDLHRAVEACCRRLEGRLERADASPASEARDGPVGRVALWIDDRPDVAALFPVAGVHLGQRDLPPAAARRVVGEGVWIGRSTHTPDELAEAVADPEVDVVAVGPVFETLGKEEPDPVVGLDFVRRARRETGRCLVAIGGIGAEDLPRVLAAGADSAAVLGAVCRGAAEAGAGGVAGVAAAARRLVAAAARAEETPETSETAEAGRPS